MRLTLYIAGRKVDLPASSLVLMTYTAEDLSNPTIVKNSYSQTVELAGTPVNDRIFGDIWRLDRATMLSAEEYGAGFDPTVKTPFQIFDDTGAIVVSGYVKLESIKRKGADHTYNIALFGGLGSFLYSLSYNGNGDKLTLADLDYLGGGAEELTFKINKTFVGTGWGYLLRPDPSFENTIHSVINFAPCYNGIPKGNFSADRGIIDPQECGLPSIQGSFTTKRDDAGNPWTVVQMSQPNDEWACKDLRSYLQRPIFSIRKFVKAVCNPKNNGGYTVDASKILDPAKVGKYADLWMTLPMIPDSKLYNKETGKASATLKSDFVTSYVVGTYKVNAGNIPAGTSFAGTFTFDIIVKAPATSKGLAFSGDFSDSYVRAIRQSCAFVQVLAYDTTGALVGGSPVAFLGDPPQTITYTWTVRETAQMLNFIPPWNEGDLFDTRFFAPNLYAVGGAVNQYASPSITLSVPSVANVSEYRVFVQPYSYVVDGNTVGAVTKYSVSQMPMYYQSNGKTLVVTTTATKVFSRSSELSYTSQSNVRSNALITKKMLLTTKDTPADYLLSLCKTFGYVMLYDKATRKITITTRNELYNGATIDINDRIARDKPITIKPFAFDTKWYDMKSDTVAGSFAKEYKDVEGRDYGSVRINTGYQFDAKAKNLMDKTVFRTAVPSQERGTAFSWLTTGTAILPTPFLATGNTYTLWNSKGESQDFPVPTPPANVGVQYYNIQHNGFDFPRTGKLQLHDADGKAKDGDGILVFLSGFTNYGSSKLTDDLPIMDKVNEGKPCWILGHGDGVNVPNFSRYEINSKNTITASLDFGRPALVNMPAVTYPDGLDVYSVGWARYLSDRYDKDTKVVTAMVDLSGLRVDQNLLRNFYWFDNCLWVLNKISNYSMTTDDLTECEFVKVDDTLNYTNGQKYK